MPKTSVAKGSARPEPKRTGCTYGSIAGRRSMDGHTPTQQKLQAATDDFAIDLRCFRGSLLCCMATRASAAKAPSRSRPHTIIRSLISRPRGQIRIGTETFAVTGLSWMDHEFGSADLGRDVVGWDWFSLHLSDSTELMWYSLRRADGRPIPPQAAPWSSPMDILTAQCTGPHH